MYNRHQLSNDSSCLLWMLSEGCSSELHGRCVNNLMWLLCYVTQWRHGCFKKKKKVIFELPLMLPLLHFQVCRMHLCCACERLLCQSVAGAISTLLWEGFWLFNLSGFKTVWDICQASPSNISWLLEHLWKRIWGTVRKWHTWPVLQQLFLS